MNNRHFSYHPMHMHIHGSCEHGASMAMHMYNAQKLGMRYIWFTDHDCRIGSKEEEIHGFSFDGALIKENATGFYHGFQPIDQKICCSVDSQSKQLTMQLTSEGGTLWCGSGVRFVSRGTLHSQPLAAGITLRIDLCDHNISPDSRLIFDIKLSQRPPALCDAHILYVLGSTEGLAAPHTQVIPLSVRNGQITMAISEDISDAPEMGGCDNAFETISIILQAKNGATATASLRDFQITTERSFEQVHEQLKTVAAQVGAQYDITPFVSWELSYAGEHKNCFNSNVPTLNYQDHDYQIPVWDAVRHMREHGGIFSINHPFAIRPLKRKTFTPLERMKILAKMQAELTANKAYGANLIEVGFPEGRNGFSGEEYLLLWDMLTVSGLFLSGYGCSDSHRDNAGWFDGNNFATYIGVPAELSHPIAEEEFTQAMKLGRMYTGDPVKLQGAVDFATTDGHPMGSVFLSCNTESKTIRFYADKTCPGWQFRLIENGLCVYTEQITSNTFSHESILKVGNLSVNFQRAELWDENGRCILVTNPIYLIQTELFAGDIPYDRIPDAE